MKPQLKVIANRPVVIGGESNPVLHRNEIQRARERHGKPFGFEKGSDFAWVSGPTVLDAWLRKRLQERQA